MLQADPTLEREVSHVTTRHASTQSPAWPPRWRRVLTARPALAGGTGQPDTENRYPNVGAIVIIAGPGTPAVKASGVLIHPRIMLTAGHVTAEGEELIRQGVPLFDISRISFGTDALDPSTWVEAVAIFTHPAYTLEPDAHSQDVGVIILKEPVDLPCATLGYEGLLDDLKDAGLLGNQGDPVKFVSAGYGSVLEFPPPRGVAPRRPAANLVPRVPCGGERLAAHEPERRRREQRRGRGRLRGAGVLRAPDGGLIVVALNSRTDVERVSLFKAYRTDTAEALGFIDLVLDLVEAGWL